MVIARETFIHLDFLTKCLNLWLNEWLHHVTLITKSVGDKTQFRASIWFSGSDLDFTIPLEQNTPPPPPQLVISIDLKLG